MASVKYWLWLTTRKGLGTLTAIRVLDRFGSPEAAYFADEGAYDLVESLSAQGKESLLDKDLSGAERILADCDRLGIRLLTLQDAEYPNRLKNIPDPPALLYLRGKLPPVDEELVIGMVGSREASAYGVKMAGTLSMDLARAGAVICSGIAPGIDTVSLKGALSAGGTVISVLAGGLDLRQSGSEARLYEDVAAAGALVSEYPPGTPHTGDHYRPRNRVISGLSEGVVVVEGKAASGALITARSALEQSREVFAVPGNVDAPNSEAPNRLLHDQEAQAVRGAADILAEFSLRYPLKVARPPLGEEEKGQRLDAVLSGPAAPGKAPAPRGEAPPQREAAPRREGPPGRRLVDRAGLTDDQLDLLLALGKESRHPDELVELTQIPARRVLSALTLLQLQGYIKEETGKRFIALVRFQ